MVSNPRNADVWETEWRIARAGGKLAELPYGLATYGCAWPGGAVSHLIWMRKPQRYHPDLPLPCAHSYQCVVLGDTGEKLVFDYPSLPNVRRELAMWSPLDRWRPRSSRLRLGRVEGESDWETMRRIRTKIENPFGVGPAAATRMVDHIRHRRRFLDGDWYLAEANGEVVGEIGLLVFDLPSGRLGRLQDVDILPRFQGRSFGRELLDAVRGEALIRGCDALCLRADAGEWPKDWYGREGFVTVGRWIRFRVGR